VHFPSDILAGALVGALCAGLVLASWRSAHAWRGARRLATAPAVLLPPR
jgi:membrane-associated phospholipid phosphatase